MSDENQEVSNANDPALKPWGMEVKQFCMFMHLSQFAGFIIPGAGLVLPIVMWATNKDNHKEVNLHGFVIFNWMISAFIYFFGCFILSFLLIGIPMMLALGIAALVFTILAAIKANEGTYWPYPLSIDFFGVKAKIAEAAEA